MGNMRRASAIGFMLAGVLTMGVTGATVATATPGHPTQVEAATSGQPVSAGWVPMREAPKMVSVTVRCDKVKNDTPGNGHSEEKIEGTGRAKNRKDAEKLAEKDVDNKMPQGYHKRHCRAIN
ncbi:hypothetical protein [Nocardia brasiliensis]|uniref:hypothetical protein n=1 Tax=Nocardia brasiliensis TaxID=37326 RepID=UPI0018950185|nr:hypothetical protein [Nocardia brasiliensis]MBF6127971.1 hypothetical protein [Nocardia brasiliensis]